MRKWLGFIVLALLAAPGLAFAQTPTFTLGQPLTAFWLGASNEADAGVDNYQYRVDTGAWTGNGQAVPQAEYTVVLPQALLTIGAHTVAVRACRASVCGAEVSFAFQIDRPLPGQPRGLGIRPTSSQATLTVPQAIDRANAYGLLILDRYPTSEELGYLAVKYQATYGQLPPNRERVISLLDREFAYLVSQ